MEEKLRLLIRELIPYNVDLDYTNTIIRNKAIIQVKRIPKRKFFIERSLQVEKLINDNYDINHIVNYYNDNYGVIIDDILKELIECHYYIMYLITNKENSITANYRNNKKNIEKTFIRISLIKEGWNGYSIEKFIKRHYEVKYKIEKHILFYFFISNMFELKDTLLKVGRPLLPLEIKDIIKSIYKVKNKEKINKIYSIYYSINNLFSTEEIEILIKDCKDNNLIKKLELLKEYSN
jgi:hypothetical protein